MPTGGDNEFGDVAACDSDVAAAAATAASASIASDEFQGAVEFDVTAAVAAAVEAAAAAAASVDADAGGDGISSPRAAGQVDVFGLPSRTNGGSRLVFWVVVLAFGATAVAVAIWYVNRGRRKRPAPLADPNGQTVDLTECFRAAAAADRAAAAAAAAAAAGEAASNDSSSAADAAKHQQQGGQTKKERTVWGIVFPSKPFLKAVAQRAVDQQVRASVRACERACVRACVCVRACACVRACVRVGGVRVVVAALPVIWLVGGAWFVSFSLSRPAHPRSMSPLHVVARALARSLRALPVLTIGLVQAGVAAGGE